jgi:hypothetical protein
MKLERTYKLIQSTMTNNPRGFTKEELYSPDKEIYSTLWESYPIALDRMDYPKSIVSTLERKFGFGIKQLEDLWNMYKKTIISAKSHEAREQYADIMKISHPNMLNEKQFKLVMYDQFKVRNPSQGL